jgi:hypothetical protein
MITTWPFNYARIVEKIECPEAKLKEAFMDFNKIGSVK